MTKNSRSSDSTDLGTGPVRNLRVSLIQTDLHWLEPKRNRAMIEALIRPLKGQTDLVVLPEMFTCGFTRKPERLAENGDPGVTTSWMLHLAAGCTCAVTGSVAFRGADGSFSNRMLFARPDGSLEYYDKVHLFQMEGEHLRYRAGGKRVQVNFLGWNILLCVCYDLRFPVFCRNRNDYDLMLCVAAWPKSRARVWRTLLQARAIENQAYVAGVNRIGRAGNGLEYQGDSLLVRFDGEVLVDHEAGSAFVETGELSANAIHQFRSDFPVWQDADSFELHLPRQDSDHASGDPDTA